MKTLAKWVVGVQDQLADLSVAFCSSLNIDIIVRRFCKKLNYRVFLLVLPQKVVSMELVLPNGKNGQVHWSRPRQKKSQSF